jgi:RHS repeat-associated protein
MIRDPDAGANAGTNADGNAGQRGGANQGGDQFVRAPALSVPAGGGAIRGIGEKFAANPVTGTASLTVPIHASPGRSGFTPELSLTYDSGAGNGPFGFGWSLALPGITRKTDKGLPRYLDAEESDVFVLSGSEDLVPELQPDGTRFKDPTTAPGYVIERYRPRIEGLFARIERWTRLTDGDVHWRSLSKDNILTLYGKDANSRIAKPGEPTRIFSWRICETRDDKGNATVYEYKGEDAAGVDQTLARERNRGEADSPERKVNRYLKRIRYGNRTPLLTAQGLRPRFLDAAMLQNAGFAFELVFDYGEHDPLDPKPLDAADWLCRHDPFSTYRSGFEIRTSRLCQRILMFHHFPAEAGVGDDCLVQSTDFVYRSMRNNPDDLRQGDPIASFVAAVSQSGYKRLGAGGYIKKSLPPLEFEYSNAVIGQDIRQVDSHSLENLPGGVDGAFYRWLDLDGEGLSGILTEQGNGWFYKRNESALTRDAKTHEFSARFAPVEPAGRKPAGTPLASGAWQFLDLDGDGRADLVALDRPAAGFFERTAGDDWGAFRSFRSQPNLAWNDPKLKFIDLTGDGRTDVLVAEDEVFTWHESLAEAGFGPQHRITAALDEERGPRVVFAEAAQTIYLADMSGDGLTDIVRIRNGEACYWPNLGFGRFGAKISMDGAPRFDRPDQFDPRRIRLGDIDGSGTSDIIYLGRNRTRFWFNQSGNSFGSANELTAFPPVDDIASVAVADLFGNGTSCLVWSTPLPGGRRTQMKYLSLMAQGKPHLLVRTLDNLGAEKRIRYAPSTYFYLRDKHAGRPWITRLPFPVQTVERVEIYDHISRNRFVTRYAYHHGYFDGAEREFRGFAMVEQWDTETLGALTANGDLPAGDNVEVASHSPPMHTRTWFHTGVYLGRGRVSDVFAGLLNTRDAGEYYREPAWRDDDVEARKRLLDDTVLPAGLSVDEEREACRALKGAMLRREVYALDATGGANYPSGQPYTVSEQNFTIEAVQRRAGQRHAVFFTHPREAIEYHCERNPTDPRVSHTLTLAVDPYGAVLRSAAVSYPRADVPDRRPEQNQTHIVLTLARVANRDDQPDRRRIGAPAETRIYEIAKPPSAGLRFAWKDVHDLVGALVDPVTDLPPAASTLAYHQWDWRSQWNPQLEPGGPAHSRLRLVEHLRTLYRPDDLGVAKADPLALLPLGTVEAMALPGESYRLAFPAGLIASLYRRPLFVPGGPPENLLPVPPDVLSGQGNSRGGYVDLDQDGQWWIPSGRIFYSPATADTAAQERALALQHFFLPRRYRDPFHSAAIGTETIVTFDAHDLLIVETRDALGNRVTAAERDAADALTVSGNDYRVLKPWLVADACRNRMAVAYDALGFVVGTAVMGKPPPAVAEGDSLDGFATELDDAAIQAHLSNPLAAPQVILQHASTRLVYDLFAYYRTKDQPSPQPAVVYTLARETHDSDPAPAGGPKFQHSFSYSDGFGREIQKKIQAEPGPVPQRDPSGKTIVGADGQPQMTANPVASRWVGNGWTVFNNKTKPVRQYESFFTDAHRFEFDVRIGVSPVLFYDPPGRLVASLQPDHSWAKTVFDAWRQESWDANDTTGIAPQDDADVKGFFVLPDGTPRLPAVVHLPTWHALRTDPAFAAAAALRWPDPRTRAAEAAAAAKAIVHAGTPSVSHADALGRGFLTVAHNKFQYSNAAPGAPQEEFYETQTIVDIEGNVRAVIDAKGRTVIRQNYDMLGHRIHRASMEAGERWMLDDATGKPYRAWDSRDHAFRIAADALRRPTDSFLRDGGGGEVLFLRRVYGELSAAAEANNLRGRVVQLLDQAGVVTSEAYDFKGNLTRSSRQLAQTYDATLDWSGAVPLEADVYGSRTRYDALNRAAEVTAPDSSIIRHGYGESRLLRTVDVNLQGAQANGQPLWTPFVVDVDYDAKGQRSRIDYAARDATLISTRCRYDRETFRLIDLYTRRGVDPQTGQGIAFTQDCDNPNPPPATIAAPPTPPPDASCGLQNLHYTYDPAGNVSQLRDDAQQTAYFHNKRVEPSAAFTYDAIYRLIEATGREHLGQVGAAPVPNSYNDRPRVGIPLSASDGAALGRYLQRYVYDEVGNFQAISHVGTDPANPGWTRTYAFNEPSQLEPAKRGNRLTATAVGATAAIYSSGGNGYDAHGNMLRMPQLQIMQWDFRDQLQMTRRQAIDNDDPDGTARQGERTWYVYDSAGQRVRKVTVAANGSVKDQRLYLGGIEIYRRPDAAAFERQTLHLADGNQRMALVETRTKGDEPGTPAQLVRYQFGNHLGSASLELDDHAQIISYEEYTPYGSTSFQAVRGQTETPKRYRYTGTERDEESGLYYHGARYYASWLGRWISVDPAGIADGVCLYAYGRCNPLKFTDPTGTTVTIHGNTATPLGGNGQVAIQTSQKLANEAFLRDIRAGLPDEEAKLFAIDRNNRLTFSGDRKKLAQFSELTRQFVGEIDSTRNIVVLPAVLAAAKRGAEADSVIASKFAVSTSGKGIEALVETRMGFGGIPGSTHVDASGTIFVAYITGLTVKAPRKGLPDVSGKPPSISETVKEFFFQGNVTQTLVHEFAAHVEGNLRGEPNEDGHFRREDQPMPLGGVTSLLDFRNKTGSDPDFTLVLKNTSKAPFERSLRLEREALANFQKKLNGQKPQGGEPNKRQEDVTLVERAEKNKITADIGVNIFNDQPGWFLPRPATLR